MIGRLQLTCAREFWSGSSQGTWLGELCRPATREVSKTDEWREERETDERSGHFPDSGAAILLNRIHLQSFLTGHNSPSWSIVRQTHQTFAIIINEVYIQGYVLWLASFGMTGLMNLWKPALPNSQGTQYIFCQPTFCFGSKSTYSSKVQWNLKIF